MPFARPIFGISLPFADREAQIEIEERWINTVHLCIFHLVDKEKWVIRG
jgi:hypothetical protein